LDNEPGLLGSARRVLATLLEIGQTRLQIASTELEEERLRLAELMLWATFSLFFLGVGLVLASLLLVLLFWEGQRELVLATISAVFLIVGAWAGTTWRRKSRNKPALLATTIAEFKRDRAALGGRSP
jgi:uncharacterized membrane protein YqjE